ncbi:carbohydrate esterase family 9 protein [Macrolepiota fuliginosa MF-IS2]|uniref:N-acetylglucosamine-6-phosphate deacetylase n=1 Tax=Macrolepiota fuliginosa MF-IS2 TaxID=1400762 RepID=A0A9P6C757_9AGAR|nr:carbohydrate esterase family 9 protein [Macrolepiota fuliginosa MF-IS2]
MTSPNGLVCFTNCLLPQEDGSLIEKDLWIDERRGVILDAQKTFYLRRNRPERIVDLGGNILSPGFIDLQLNGGYGFDFSVYEDDDEAYKKGLQMVADRIIETGVTSLLPTIITQERSFYPKILGLLRPFQTEKSAAFLGWHAEGPFIEHSKRGAHAPSYLLDAPNGTKSFEEVYGADNLVHQEDWLMGSEHSAAVRLITTAPEITGVMDAMKELNRRGIVLSIGHSTATTEVATNAVRHGAKLITHLFNAMPQLHHRDPSIIGLLGASPHISPLPESVDQSRTASPVFNSTPGPVEEPSHVTPPQSPTSAKLPSGASTPSSTTNHKGSRKSLHLEKGQVADMEFERPFYGLIVDGIHCHPNSVRLAYSAHSEGCILITDAMKILDPHLKDGVYEWREGQRYVKEGLRLYLEGTDTLAGSVVTLDKCVRNFSRFTGCSLGEAIKCATYNPARCLGVENKKGTLRPGADADFVVLSRQGTVLSTWVKGKQAYVANRSATT